MTNEDGNSRVLVVDDQPDMVNALRYVFLADGYQVRTALDGRTALASIREWRPDLVTTDLGMAPMSGIELCKAIRADSKMPIIVVSGEDAPASKVEALDAGADDYLVKPFDPAELLARVRALWRRGASEPAAGSLDVGDFRIDLDARRVCVRASTVRLTPKEFDVLVYLAERHDRVVPYARLLAAVWGFAYSNHREYLRVVMRQLRGKLEENPSQPRYLLTEPWIGYRFSSTPLAELRSA